MNEYLWATVIKDLVVVVGASYLVFFVGISPWWWVLAVIFLSNYSPKEKS